VAHPSIVAATATCGKVRKHRCFGDLLSLLRYWSVKRRVAVVKKLVSAEKPAPILRRMLRLPLLKHFDEIPQRFKDPDPLRVLTFGG
jgi:hypothetical protein